MSVTGHRCEEVLQSQLVQLDQSVSSSGSVVSLAGSVVSSAGSVT